MDTNTKVSIEIFDDSTPTPTECEKSYRKKYNDLLLKNDDLRNYMDLCKQYISKEV